LKNKIFNTSLICILIFLANSELFSQPYSSSDIRQALNKLNVLGSVLYIAAHPDDENTRILSYMSRGRLMRTAYLSLTRGDGGQNLLGPEKGPLLGVIRTQELLAARRLDGADQFFTRAVDFGYSKSAEETLKKWDREIILGDMVKVIRQFRPDIILTRFSTTQGGHGHHLASAMLAVEAYSAAADPKRFPDQLDKLNTWQVKRAMWNSWRPGPEAVEVEVGEYNPILGQSYNEIASYGRSMHKSQGFGSSVARDSQIETFDLMIGDSAHDDLFTGVDLTWNRVENSENIQRKVNKIIGNYDDEKPAKSIPDLIELYSELAARKDQWSQWKKEETAKLIKMCSGLWLESIVWQEGIAPGKEIDVRSSAIKRTDIPIKLEKIETTFSDNDSTLNQSLELYKPVSVKQSITIPVNTKYTQPFWLQKTGTENMFTLPGDEYIGKAENSPAMTAKFHISIYDTEFTYEEPVRYRWTDAVKGEQFQPFIIRPSLNVSVENPTYIFAGEKAQKINVSLEANENNQSGVLSLELPAGWQVKPENFPFSFQEAGEVASFSFQLQPGKNATDGDLQVKAKTSEKIYTDHILKIAYDHTGMQTVLRPAKSRLVNLNIKIEPRKIGYIMGSGDDIPQSLAQLGYEIDLLSDDDLAVKNLNIYDVIICGVRAFNTREVLGHQQQRLIDFVEQGGTWIVQHNTRFGFKVDQIGPYRYDVGRDRISQEDASIQILMPEHQIFNYPNKITEKDFDGWVQERGLYFASSWKGKLYPLLSGNDTGEPAKLGGLLYAPYGKGVFIYTAYSWFRQLPAGVPGAYRIFVNILSARGK
jgi:LmbE family N-acetylglucosaminyl deacetylase